MERLWENAPLNPLMGQETVYGGRAHGYTDYPKLEQSRAATDVGDWRRPEEPNLTAPPDL